jgi:SAM-dependent methyltransferase
MKIHEDYEKEINSYFDNLPPESFEDKHCFYCWDGQDRYLLFKKGTMDVYRCRCGFVYNGRQANEKALGDFYKKSDAMDRWADLKETWDEKYRQRNKFERAARFLVDGGINSVLDVGCGNGHFLSFFPDHIRRVGIETNKYAAEIARR